MGISHVLQLVMGLALFLFGMQVMGEALEKRAGSRLKGILAKLTASKFKGLLLGLGVTAIIQSSSATTVMVVGFVNSGIMALNQAIGVIMGANIGTTVTAWILSLTGISGESFFVQMLNPKFFTPIFALVGVVLYLFIKDSKKNDIGLILLGFATLMFGMQNMSEAVSVLENNQQFGQILTMFQNPILGVLAGAVITAIIQSSSASVGILQALSATGKVSLGGAIPIIMGQNIGTCITAIISSVSANKNAKRAAAIHLYFNIIGTAVALAVYCLADFLFALPFRNMAANQVSIAVVHTAFNVICTVLIYPFSDKLVKLAEITVRDSKDSKENQVSKALDERLLATPVIALESCKNVVDQMAKTSFDTLKKSLSLFDAYDEKAFKLINEAEGEVDKYEDLIGSYLVKLGDKNVSAENSRDVTKYLHAIGDLERISDHAVNLAKAVDEMNDKKLEFSPKAKEDLGIMFKAVSEILDITLEGIVTDDESVAVRVEPLEQVIDTLKADIKKGHIQRLQKEECTIEMGFILSDVITNLERVSDHCSNIAGCIIELSHNNGLSMHEFLHSVKDGSDASSAEFNSLYKSYLEKYHVEA